MKMCIQADLDNPGALRHMNKNNSERPVWITRTCPPLPTFFVSPKGGTFLLAFSAWKRRAGRRWRWQPMSLYRRPRSKSFRARTRAISRSITIPRMPTTVRRSMGKKVQVYVGLEVSLSGLLCRWKTTISSGHCASDRVWMTGPERGSERGGPQNQFGANMKFRAKNKKYPCE